MDQVQMTDQLQETTQNNEKSNQDPLETNPEKQEQNNVGIQHKIKKNTQQIRNKASRGKRISLSNPTINKPNDERDYSTNGLLWTILMQKFFEESKKEKKLQKTQVQIRNEIGGMEQNTFCKYKWAFNFIMKFSLPKELLQHLLNEKQCSKI
ncbi:hypothetical protein pb186bvf_017457 [Paramecium bursaria]